MSDDAGCEVRPVAGVPGFLEIADSTVKLSQLQAYKSGAIVGMDLSSGIAALALSVSPGDNVLDLCCAPGAKLLFLAEMLHNDRCNTGESDNIARGSVTGIDISAHRAATCRSLSNDMTWRKQRQAEGRPWFAGKQLGSAYACCGIELYDRVLVDAECTHDGSLAHVYKYERWGWEQLDSRVINDNRSASVPLLQTRLLENGWRLLKPGGILVYSTCSLSRYQNEYVLGGFLSRHPEDEACVEMVPLLDSSTVAVSPIWKPENDAEWASHGLESQRHLFARMSHSFRLDPTVSNTSGMFVARIRKLKHGFDFSDYADQLVPLGSANTEHSNK
ncbi:hypothetical protein GGH99_006257 [Coemansia sp. RSA 1285]|nr:hypothetical protein GGH99_006257 [Coemansia sp. RSA 1285]